MDSEKAAKTTSRRRSLMAVYRRLRRSFGHAGWWPGDTPFEVCLGAILTQNTSWTNVEKALAALRQRDLISYEALGRYPPSQLAPLIRASRYYNVKARRIAGFLRFLGREYDGRVEAMRNERPLELRQKLLSVKGIGRETADSIVLYAAGLPLFVVDAYTRRIFSRLGIIAGGEQYDEIQRLCMRGVPKDPGLYNDFHAQLVRLGKDVCRPRPRCAECPIGDLCPKTGIASH